MASLSNFKLLRPKLSPNWTKNGKNHPFLHSIRSDRSDQFRSKLLKIWPGSQSFDPKFDPIESIRSWVDPIELILSSRSDRSYRVDPIDPIESIRSNRLQKWIPGQILSCLDLNFVQIGPKMVDFCRRSDRRNRIDAIGSIGSSRFNKKWLPGQILSCLDLNLVQIGPKMAKINHFWSDLDKI